MNVKKLNEIIAWRGNITAGEVARLDKVMKANKKKEVIEPSMNRAIAEGMKRCTQ